MARSVGKRSFTRSLTALFRAPRSRNPHKDLPYDYYKTVWIGQKQYDAIAFVADNNHISVKKLVDDLLARGLGQYLSEKILESNEQEERLREQGQRIRATAFIYAFKRWAKSKGYNIDKFF